MLNRSHLNYIGSIRPAAIDALGYSIGPFALDTQRGEFVMVGKDQRVYRLKVVEPRMGGRIADYPIAELAGAASDVTNGDWSIDDVAVVGSRPSGTTLGGLLVIDDVLLAMGTIYYDAALIQRRSVFATAWPVVGGTASRGKWKPIGDPMRQGWVAGPMARVPERFREALEGDVVSGQSGLPIIGRQSFGPCAIAYRSASLIQGTIPSTMLVGYPADHQVAGTKWDGPANEIFNSSTAITGMAFVGDDLVFVGRHGYGPACYGTGVNDKKKVGPGSCYDPHSQSKGTHAYPYRAQAWVYPVRELADVAAGTRKPWDLIPTVFALEDRIAGNAGPLPYYTHVHYGVADGIGHLHPVGLVYDEARHRLYLPVFAQGSIGYEPSPLIHVFDVAVDPIVVDTKPAPDKAIEEKLQLEVDGLRRELHVQDETIKKQGALIGQLHAEVGQAKQDYAAVAGRERQMLIEREALKLALRRVLEQ